MFRTAVGLVSFALLYVVLLQGGNGMLETAFVLAFFGLLYVDIIEVLEKCDHPDASL